MTTPTSVGLNGPSRLETDDLESTLHVLRASISAGRDDSLDGVPAALACVVAAAEALFPGETPALQRESGPAAVSDADAMVDGLVKEILREQESHYCCAESSNLRVTWLGTEPARLTLQLGISFQQGRYEAECACYGDADVLASLRESVTQRLDSLGVAVTGERRTRHD